MHLGVLVAVSFAVAVVTVLFARRISRCLVRWGAGIHLWGRGICSAGTRAVTCVCETLAVQRTNYMFRVSMFRVSMFHVSMARVPMFRDRNGI